MASFTIPKSSAIVQNLPVGTFYKVTINADGSQTWDDTPTATAGAAVTDIGTLTVTGEDAEAVATSATTQINALGTKLNALLASLRTGGSIAT